MSAAEAYDQAVMKDKKGKGHTNFPKHIYDSRKND